MAPTTELGLRFPSLLHLTRQCPHSHTQWHRATASRLALFSTTAPLSKAKIVHKRGVKANAKQNNRKRRVTERVRPPAEGERKAMRKRVILSNVNALEVPGLQDISAEEGVTAIHEGTMLGLPGPLVDQLRAVEAFKPKQSWGMFRRPAFLVTSETVELAEAMESSSGAGKGLRRILVGDRGSGKSVLLLQAMAMAFLREWVVISIPEAMDLVIAHTAYAPVPKTKPTKYAQPTYTAALLQRIVRANPILETLKPLNPQSFPTFTDTSKSPTLADLIKQSSTNTDLAWPTFDALWADLSSPSRPPVLLALDGLSKIMQNSAYRSMKYDIIHAHDLALVDWFVNALSGKTALPNGGMVLAALSNNNTAPNMTFDLQMKRLETMQLIQEGKLNHDPTADPIAPFLEATGGISDPVPKIDQLVRHDVRVLEALGEALGEAAEGENEKGGRVPFIQRVKGLSRDEARALMEYWAKSGMARQKITQQHVSDQWSLSGGGVVAELERSCFRMRI